MKTKLLTALLLVFALVGTASAAIPIRLESVKVNGVELSEDNVNKLSVERGQELLIDLTLTALEDINDFEVRAFISGFEYNDVDRIEDTTELDDLEAGITYTKSLKLKISDLVESDDYKLRLFFTDRNNNEVKKYPLKIDLPRHALKIQDVIFYPSNTVKAGHALLTSVRVENKGEKDEEDVKVTVSIPELGLSTSNYIEEIKAGDEEEQTEELYLRLNKCTKPGEYRLVVSVSFDNNYRSLQPVTKIINVEPNPACGSDSRSAVVNIKSFSENIRRGTSVVYPIKVTNKARTQQSFTLSVNSPNNGLRISVKPTSTVLLKNGESHTFNVLVTATNNAPVGGLNLIARVNSGEKVVQELTLKANVSEDENKENMRVLLETGLLVLVVVLVILGLVVVLSKLVSSD